jgi:hypothetical protein
MENLTEALVACAQYITGYKLQKTKAGTIALAELSTYLVEEETCEDADSVSFSTSGSSQIPLVEGLPPMRGLFAVKCKRTNKPVGLRSPIFTEFLTVHGLTVKNFNTKPNQLGVYKCSTPKIALYHRLTEAPVLNSKTGMAYPNLYKTRPRLKKFMAKSPWADYSDAELRELAEFNSVKLGRTVKRDSVIKKLETAGVHP